MAAMGERFAGGQCTVEGQAAAAAQVHDERKGPIAAIVEWDMNHIRCACEAATRHAAQRGARFFLLVRDRRQTARLSHGLRRRLREAGCEATHLLAVAPQEGREDLCPWSERALVVGREREGLSVVRAVSKDLIQYHGWR